MRDRRPVRRLLAALGATVAVGAIVGAPALAAPQDWAGSKFSEQTLTAHAAENFPIGGVLVRTRGSGEAFDRRIQDARLSFAFREGEEELHAPECIPSPTINASVQKSETFANRTSTMTFSLAAEHFAWTCNGTFDIVATGTAAPSDTFDLEGTIRVAVPPTAVTEMGAQVADGDAAPDPATGATADDPATVEVAWTMLEKPDETYPDFVGYRVQRAGPAGESAFETVSGVIEHDDEVETGEYVDTIEAPGIYRYRVQSLRAGAEGPAKPVPSTADTTLVADVEIDGPPPTTTTTTAPETIDPTTSQRRTLGLPHVSRTKSTSPKPTAPTTPTTLDTGFDESLDYGDRDVPEPGDELADGGQSIIQTESEGAGLLGPVAGAMVLLGWAGHVAYLNRLAKQF
ncbi:hypothetical protein [Actinospongicola halichondriae]|uniref:hypothetical protein n=1 Tax=Actinospongicola halichondriae TaxID=3236844 RepID=UPI003D5AD62B